MVITHEVLHTKNSSEWKNRPVWVRALFIGSSLVRMDRRQLQSVEKFEGIAGIVCVVAGQLALFDLFIPAENATTLLFFSMTLFAAAYLASRNIAIGDKFSVWPWLQAAAHSNPRRLAFNVMSVFSLFFVLAMFVPVWV